MMPKFPYWPAKLMKVGEKHVVVNFFGETTLETIEWANCKIYSLSDKVTRKNSRLKEGIIVRIVYSFHTSYVPEHLGQM